MAATYRFGHLVPTTLSDTYYLSNVQSSPDDDFSYLNDKMLSAAGNPANYQFGTSEPFDDEEACATEVDRKKSELETNGYTVSVLIV